MSFALRIAVLLALLAAALPTYWLTSRLALRTSAPSVWLRRLLVSLWVVAGISYVALLLAGLGEHGRRAVELLFPSLPYVTPFAGDVAAQFTVALGAAGVTVAAYATTVPAIRTAREIDLSTRTAVARLGRYAIAFAALLSVVAILFLRVVVGDATAFAPIALLALVVGISLASPRLIRLFRSVREPVPFERDAIEQAMSRAGMDRADLDVGNVSILDDADETIEIYVRGPPGRRRLFVSEFALRALEGETLAALLAVHAGRVEHHHRQIARYPLFGFIALGLAAIVWESPIALLVAVVVGVTFPLPTLWAARRAVRRADDSAAARVGAEAVADALERSASEQNLDIPDGGLRYVLKTRPALRERIDRLRERATE